jgi:hypothetical protein
MPDISFKFANKEEIAESAKLYQTVFKRFVAGKELEWLYVQNPLVDKFYYNRIALNVEKEIIGHTAFIPVHYVFEGKLIKGAISAGSMVLSGYGGIFPKLLMDLERRLISDGFELLIAFSNENSFPFFKRYKYQESFFDYLQLKIDQAKEIDQDIPCKDLTNGIINRMGDQFLKWRIFGHPVNDYSTSDNVGLKFIFKRYMENEIDVMCLFFEEGKFSLAPLLEYVLGIEQAEKINLYSTSPLFSEVLMRAGFQKIARRNKLVYKILSPSLKSGRLFLQMIDSDVV